MKDFLPYIVSIVSAVISGCASYFISRKQFKEDLKRLEKQHELDIEKEREMFKIEKEKMELEHQYKMELLQKEAENKMGSEIINTLFSKAMDNPEIQNQLSQGIKRGNRNNIRR